MKLAYYPGCVSRSTGKEMDISTRTVCAALGIELQELEDWNCCGATHVSNELVSVGLAARNMAQTDLAIMTPCSICYSNLRSAAQAMEEPEVQAKVNAVLTRKYSGAKIRHALDVILDQLLPDFAAHELVLLAKRNIGKGLRISLQFVHINNASDVNTTMAEVNSDFLLIAQRIGVHRRSGWSGFS